MTLARLCDIGVSIMAITLGRKLEFGRKLEYGVKDPLPLRGFPPGRVRIRQRNTAFTVIFIRPPEGGIRRFVVEERDGAWWPAIETGRNKPYKVTYTKR